MDPGKIGRFGQNAFFDLGCLGAVLPVGIFKLHDADHIFGRLITTGILARPGIDRIKPVFAFVTGIKVKNAVFNFLEQRILFIIGQVAARTDLDNGDFRFNRREEFNALAQHAKRTPDNDQNDKGRRHHQPIEAK